MGLFTARGLPWKRAVHQAGRSCREGLCPNPHQLRWSTKALKKKGKKKKKRSEREAGGVAGWEATQCEPTPLRARRCLSSTSSCSITARRGCDSSEPCPQTHTHREGTQPAPRTAGRRTGLGTRTAMDTNPQTAACSRGTAALRVRGTARRSAPLLPDPHRSLRVRSIPQLSCAAPSSTARLGAARARPRLRTSPKAPHGALNPPGPPAPPRPATPPNSNGAPFSDQVVAVSGTNLLFPHPPTPPC